MMEQVMALIDTVIPTYRPLFRASVQRVSTESETTFVRQGWGSERFEDSFETSSDKKSSSKKDDFDTIDWLDTWRAPGEELERIERDHSDGMVGKKSRND
jgi:hypothetical protein